MLLSKKLLTLKEAIESDKADRLAKEAEFKHTKNILKDEHELSSLKEAKIKLEETQTEYEELSEQVKKRIDKIEEKYLNESNL